MGHALKSHFSDAKTTTHTFIAKRHKTVRTFLTNFENFSVLA
jgi:hypothetical protein